MLPIFLRCSEGLRALRQFNGQTSVPFAVTLRSFASANLKQKPDTAQDETQTVKAKKVRPKPQRDVLFGIHPVDICLDTKKRTVYKAYLSKQPGKGNDNIDRLTAKIASREISIKPLRLDQMDKMTNYGLHQGIALKVSPLKLPLWSDAIETFGPSDDSCLLSIYLDRIQDPMNMGAIIRTAVFLGVDAIFVPRKNSCRLGPVTCKASSGALEIAPLVSVDDPFKFFSFVHRLGWDIVGTDSGCAPLVKHEVTNRNRLIILGNEGSGIEEDLVNLLTTTVSIDSSNKTIDSLNVSVAAGILMSHFVKNKV